MRTTSSRSESSKRVTSPALLRRTGSPKGLINRKAAAPASLDLRVERGAQALP